MIAEVSHHSIAPPRADDRLQALLTFCQQHGPPRCFGGWPAETLEAYLLFHIHRGTLAYVMRQHRPVALAIGYQRTRAELEAPASADRPFEWQPSNPLGDCFYLAELVIEPAERAQRREIIMALIGELQARFPGWRSLRFYAHRRNRLYHFNPISYFRRLIQQR